VINYLFIQCTPGYAYAVAEDFSICTPKPHPFRNFASVPHAVIICFMDSSHQSNLPMTMITVDTFGCPRDLIS